MSKKEYTGKTLDQIVAELEVWRDVVGYEGLYKVSTKGRVKRLQSNHVLKPRVVSKWGYLSVSLSKKGKVKQFLVHRLVLETFVGPCPEGHQCRHFPDNDPTNNDVRNLQWGTPKENHKDKVAHGTNYVPRGEDNYNAKLTEGKVRKIRRMYATGKYIQRKLGEMFGVKELSIYSIVNHKAWKHII